MHEPEFQLTVLGSRGSMAVGGAQYAAFGGSTSCYWIRAGEENIFLDAGNGLLHAPTDFPRTPVILLSHLHLDHILGLGMYPRFSAPGKETLLYVPVRQGENARALLDHLYSVPYWPLSLADYTGDLRILPLSFPLRVGEVQVDGIEGNHPGGCKAMRLRFRGKCMVYLSDYEHDAAQFPAMADFAQGADLLLYDGQFTPEAYAQKTGHGHSTAEAGIALMEKCGARRLLIVHHDPQSTDRILRARESQINREDVTFAREGMVIVL